MLNKDIKFEIKESKILFNYRVAALIITKDKILLQKNKYDHFYTLIGGKVKSNETSKEAIVREIKEETGLDIPNDNVNINCVIENFFRYKNNKYHEILIIYRLTNTKPLAKKNNFISQDDNNVINTWLEIDKLKKYNIKPLVIKKIIYDNTFKHLIIKNNQVIIKD